MRVKKLKFFALVLKTKKVEIKTKKVEIILLVRRIHVSETAINSVAGKFLFLCFLCVVNVLETKNLS